MAARAFRCGACEAGAFALGGRGCSRRFPVSQTPLSSASGVFQRVPRPTRSASSDEDGRAGARWRGAGARSRRPDPRRIFGALPRCDRSDASVYEAHLVFEDEVGDDLALGNKVLVPVEKSARWVGDFGYDGLGHDSG